MTDEDLAQLIEQGHESNGVEFKSSGSLGDLTFVAKLVRAILGLSNRRDGGVVVIGVSENADKSLDPTGMLGSDGDTWDLDRLSGILSGYADPSVQLSLEARTYHGHTFQVVVVREFDEVPILCKKPYMDPSARGGAAPREILRQGACYVRSLRKPETSEVASQEDMRALIALAIEKGVIRWVALARLSGLITPVPDQQRTAPSRYDKEIEDLL